MQFTDWFSMFVGNSHQRAIPRTEDWVSNKRERDY